MFRPATAECLCSSLAVCACLHPAGVVPRGFRYLGMRALAATAMAVGIYGSVFLLLLIVRWEGVPAQPGPDTAAGVFAAGRWLARAGPLSTAPDGWGRAEKAKGRLVAGAGEAGVQTAFAMSVMREFVVRGFVDDDAQKIGGSINGLPIIRPKPLKFLFNGMALRIFCWPSRPCRASSATPSLAGCSLCPPTCGTLPGMVDLASGKASVADFQELDIEDLLAVRPCNQMPLCWLKTCVTRWCWSLVRGWQHWQRAVPPNFAGAASPAGFVGYTTSLACMPFIKS